MPQLATRHALHDPATCRHALDVDGGPCILDTEAFVRATIGKVHLVASLEDREELVAEGLLIMVRLHRSYQPGKNGLDPTKSMFSGYCAKYLPGKLSDAWHKLNPSHRLQTDGDGKRRWQYDDPAASLDALTRDTDEGRDAAMRSDDSYLNGDMANTLREALDRRWEHDRENTVRFGVLLGMDYTPADAARLLRLPATEVALIVGRIKTVAHELMAVAA